MSFENEGSSITWSPEFAKTIRFGRAAVLREVVQGVDISHALWARTVITILLANSNYFNFSSLSRWWHNRGANPFIASPWLQEESRYVFAPREHGTGSRTHPSCGPAHLSQRPSSSHPT